MGTIIYIVIFVYLIIRVLISMQNVSLSIYEVQNSYIDTNINATALIVREEKLVNADSSGYVSYYVRDGERIGKNKTVYTVDETGSIYDKIKDQDEESLSMSKEGLEEVRTRISNYENYFDYSDYSEVYNFRYDIENAVLELTNEAFIEQLTSLDGQEGNLSTYKKVSTKETGIITYYQDGYENFDINNFKAEDVNKSNYKKTTLKTGEIINAGDPVYKLVTSENWNLVVPIQESQTFYFNDKSIARININNSSKDVKCPFEIREVDGEFFLILSLDKQMVNYINERYIDIVILLDQNNGLKIPNTSIAEKEVYKVPIEFLTTGSNSSGQTCINLKKFDENGDVTLKQIQPDIYQKNEKYCYLDPNDFSIEDVIVNPVTNETLAVANMTRENIKGVYCVNQGFATFRIVDISYKDDEYTVVNADVDYSISWYDRIILDQSVVTENQIIK